MNYAVLALLVANVVLVLTTLDRIGLRSLLQKNYCCPQCGKDDSLVRFPRFSFDRIINCCISCQRYSCYACCWNGLIRTAIKESRIAQRDSAFHTTSARSTNRPRS